MTIFGPICESTPNTVSLSDSLSIEGTFETGIRASHSLSAPACLKYSNTLTVHSNGRGVASMFFALTSSTLHSDPLSAFF